MKKATTVDGTRRRARVGATGAAFALLLVVAAALAGPLPGRAQAADTGTWEETESLATARSNHTATLLTDGRVLVVGGSGSANATEPSTTASSELFTLDPVTGEATWSAAPALAFARTNHTATVLNPPSCLEPNPPEGYPCGAVLAVGGSELLSPGLSFTARAGVGGTAELYVPGDGWQSCPGTGANPSCPGPLKVKREHHTATLLDDGTVLVTTGTARLAERYHPLTGTWGDAGETHFGRQGARAALLSNGKVLLAGGYIGQGSKSAEIYDPNDDSWVLTGSMSGAIRDFTMTVLDASACHQGGPPTWCGKVLVAGGLLDDGSASTTAELYDPNSGTWQSTGDMGVARQEGHTATALGDGRVLVAGGTQASSPLAEAEVYDPATGSWSSTAAFPDPQPGPPNENARASHTATRLGGGQVLVAGGCCAGNARLASVLLYRSSTPPPVPVVTGISPPWGPTTGGTEVTLVGRNLSGVTRVRFGDVDASGLPIRVSDTEVRATAPPQPAGPVDLRAENLGGMSAVSPAARFTYRAGRGLWDTTGSTATAVAGHTATMLADGRLLLAGGTHPLIKDQGHAALYDPVAGVWADTGSMLADHVDGTATLLDGPECRSGDPPSHCGTVLVVGGDGGSSLVGNSPTPVELYHPGAKGRRPVLVSEAAALWTYEEVDGGWSVAAPMAGLRASHTATLLNDGTVLVAGGDASGTAERYRAGSAGGSWSSAGSLGAPRYGHTATLLPGGKVLVSGGCLSTASEACVPTSTALLFDPAAPLATAWSATGHLGQDRSFHTATLLTDGTVLVAGGCVPPASRCGSGSGTVADPATASAEVYDPATGSWHGVDRLSDSRYGHRATPLPSGKVLVTGGTRPGSQAPRATAEIYDPVTTTWGPAPPTGVGRVQHTATLLPTGPASACGNNCGKVIVAGGCCATNGAIVATTEQYAPPPEVSAVMPVRGPTAGGTSVVIEGSGFAGAIAVGFADKSAASFATDPASPATRITAVSPKHGAGPAEVAVSTLHSLDRVLESMPGSAASFSYFVPDRPWDLVATALSDTEVRLSFLAPDDPPATRYVVKQSTSPLDTDAAFAVASALCGGTCQLPRRDLHNLTVAGLFPGTTYHFALRAERPDGSLGPRSDSVSATTSGIAPSPKPPDTGTLLDHSGCPALGTVADGSVTYPAGYSLVGLPAGAVVGSQSPLYGWFDLGAGGTYSTRAAAEPVPGGRGYWAYFSCPRVLGALPGGDARAELPLGSYRASMVGNPSGTGPVSVSGHDYAASWDPSLNDGAGGYSLSGYRETRRLGVGQGAWVFSYTDTTIQLGA